MTTIDLDMMPFPFWISEHIFVAIQEQKNIIQRITDMIALYYIIRKEIAQ